MAHSHGSTVETKPESSSIVRRDGSDVHSASRRIETPKSQPQPSKSGDNSSISIKPMRQLDSVKPTADRLAGTNSGTVGVTQHGLETSRAITLPDSVPDISDRIPTPQPPPHSIPQPHNHDAFHQMLLRLIYFTRPPLDLAVILDYFTCYPRLHTTQTYNVIMAYTLRHGAYGSFLSLAKALHASRLPRNMETTKLEVRYMVHRGAWDQAWRLVTEPTSTRSPNTIPLPIWVEFFQFRRLGYDPPRRTRARLTGVMPSRQQGDALKDWDPRLKLLFEWAPAEMSDPRRIPPRVILSIVTHLLRLHRFDHAMTLTTSYLRSIPRRLTPRRREDCINIVNAHVALGSSATGLRKLRDGEKTLKILLRLHSNIRPNATTLFLLLSGLRKAKHCGTRAERVVRKFAGKWGKELKEDLRVRRRVASLALKEGRLDIAKAYSTDPKGTKTGRSTSESPTEANPTLRFRRLSDKVLLSRRGEDRRLWQRVRMRTKFALRRAPEAESSGRKRPKVRQQQV
ncbi:hypothetical protein CC1G_10520 [Coprinopsis cinerea okayama7|uniref:Uncharacterized protein n=1 Tax=Coprinopsis cinerea (strain Okayama-7 / 130 / ATCC MYA-4618 / FGSC 9003) TaxID=240176 RepID=A8N199_COPC7|nr:hypothetical protein CC1G_10520 [Coprinopsis cinerea okayama7\|eukprot:XP_001828648.1 hypothetical protein CC1G_10520 [Coprinopsis cinerea okayama7\